jgi:hypothetical protein
MFDARFCIGFIDNDIINIRFVYLFFVKCAIILLTGISLNDHYCPTTQD